MSSSSSFDNKPLCYCGRRAAVRMSRKEQSKGRKFLGCSMWDEVGGGCNYFRWVHSKSTLENEEEISSSIVESSQNALFHEERMSNAVKKIEKLRKKVVAQKDIEDKLVFRLNLAICALTISIGVIIGLLSYCKCNRCTP